MIPLTDKENKSCKNQKVCYICKKKFNTDKNAFNPYTQRSLSLYWKILRRCS